MGKTIKECLERVEGAFEGLYSREQVIQVLGDLDNFMQTKGLSPEQLQKNLEKTLFDAEMKQALRKKNILKDNLKMNANVKKFANLKSGFDFEIRMRNFVDRVGHGFNIQLDDFNHQFLNLLRGEKIDDVLTDIQKHGGKSIDQEQLARYLHELNQAEDIKVKDLKDIPVEHQKTYKLATVMAKMQRTFLQVKRESGAATEFLSGRIGRQDWNPHKIGLKVEKFKKDLLDNVNWAKTSTVVEGKTLSKEEFIDYFTENVMSGTWRDEFDPDFFTEKDLATPISRLEAKAGLEQALESKRGITIRPKVWNAIMEEYGVGNTFDSFMKEMEQTARSYSMITELGTNPAASYKLMLSNIGSQNKQLGMGGNLPTNNKINEQFFEQLTGAADKPQFKEFNFFGKRINLAETNAFLGSSMRLFQGTEKLALSIVSAFSDVLIPAIRTSSIQGQGKFWKTTKSFYNSLGTTFQEIAGIYGSKEAKRITQLEIDRMQDEFFSMAQAHRFNEIHSSEFKPGVEGGLLAKIVNPINRFHEKIFEYNPMVHWTRYRQKGADIAIAREWGSIASEYGSFKKLPEHLQDYLREIQIDDIWDDIIPYIDKFDDGKSYLIKDVAERMSDADIEKYIKKKGGQTSITAARRELNLKVKSVYSLENSRRILMPSASTKAHLSFGQARGTFIGEVTRNFAQFKSFAVDLWLNSVAPAVQRNGAVNTFGTYLPAALLLSVAQTSVRDLIEGRSPRNFFDLSNEEARSQAVTNWSASLGFAMGLPVFDQLIRSIGQVIGGETVSPYMAANSMLGGLLGPATSEPIMSAIETSTILFNEDVDKKKEAAGRMITNAPVIGPALHGHVLGRALKGNIMSGIYSFFDEDYLDKLEDYAERQGSEKLY